MITVRWPRVEAAFPQVEFRRLFRQIRRPAADEAPMVTAYTDGAVTLRSNRRLDGYHEAADMSGMQGVKVGDFVVHGLDILRGSVGVSDADGAMSSVCVICAPIIDVEPRYFAWQIRAQAASGLPRALARGVREGGADFRRWDTLAELPVLCPPLTAQRAIADFLDAETTRINVLITKKERMIALARERRQAIITAAITGNSADEPAELGRLKWSVAPLKHLAILPITNGVGEAAEFDEPSWPRYVRTTDIAGPRELRSDTFKSLPPDTARRASLMQGDIVMTAAGATIGKSLLYGAPGEACYAGYLVRFRPKAGVDGRFVAYWMESSHYWAQIAMGKVVSTIENFSAGKYQNLRCPAPSAAKQREVADFLDRETSHIDAITTKISTQIDLLRERRQALISGAVTGEFVVPGVAA